MLLLDNAGYSNGVQRRCCERLRATRSTEHLFSSGHSGQFAFRRFVGDPERWPPGQRSWPDHAPSGSEWAGLAGICALLLPNAAVLTYGPLIETWSSSQYRVNCVCLQQPQASGTSQAAG
jgi:hypothetical protein